ncbi:tetratricopeptide repeat protein [Streptomyces sp. 058-1L]|uniref:tetratricopeptide repeat protein n=1 Tax=Streptomyces sp. 058-1L TaxID=2789266 RepID=UPI00397F7070
MASAVAVAAALMTAASGPVANYASATVPSWATHAWLVWPVFGLLTVVGTGLLLWERRLSEDGPPVPPVPVGRLAHDRHGSLRRRHVERVRGREEELAVLTRMLRRPDGRFAVVCGAGGLGKTTVAAQLATRAEEAGWAVFWMRWHEPADLAQQWIQVAVACGLSDADLESARAGQRSLPDLVWNRLEGSRRWLVVLDNVDEPEAVGPAGEPVAHYRGWIRPHGRGLLLVTSRDTSERTWGPRGRLLRLKPLETPAAGQVLLDAAPQAGTGQQAGELAVRLGGLPLALRTAGSYLAAPTSRYKTFDRYRRALDIEPALLAAEHPDASRPEVARTVVRHTWELSLDQLAAEGSAQARPLLRLLALLAPAPVPLSLITPGLLTSVTGGRVTAVDVEAAFAGLHRFGLLGLPDPPPAQGTYLRDDDSTQVVLHPLVREISALALATEAADIAAWHRALAARLAEAAHEVVSTGRSAWPAARRLAPHTALLSAQATAEDLPGIRDTLRPLAALLREAGAYGPEYAVLLQLLGAQGRVLGSAHTDTLTSRNDLARALYRRGDYAQAAALHRETLVDRVRALGADHPHTLTSRNDLARALYGIGHYTQAAALHRQTLADRERVLGADHPHTLATRDDLARAVRRTGDYAQAAALHRRTLEDCVRVLGPDHPHTLATRNNLAHALRGMGDHAQAVALHRQTLDDRIRTLGPDHPHTLTSRNDLARALDGMGDHAQAAALHRRTLEDCVRVLGPDHPHTLATRNNLAHALRGIGDHAQAVALHRQTLDDRIRVLGPDHPHTRISRTDLELALAMSRTARRRPRRWSRRRTAGG